MARLGRTKRRRLNRSATTNKVNRYLNDDDSVINLKRWMKANDWRDETELRLAEFTPTGRGVYSTKNIAANEDLIEIPFDLMISLPVLEKSPLKHILHDSKDKFTIQEMLAMFLVLEKNSGEESKWSNYIRSLPSDVYVPWACSNAELRCLPAELKRAVQDCEKNVAETWGRVEKLKSRWKHVSRRDNLTRESYVEAYILVDTRAVYVDPVKVKDVSDGSLNDILSDDPSMALSPFLDMFNHSCRTDTTAELRRTPGGLKYYIINNKRSRKYHQIFISYGQHDNKRLFIQYGFIIPGNTNEKVEFTLNEVISTTGSSNITERQYKFIRTRSLDRNLYINNNQGFSFNLTAVFYVLTNCDETNYSKSVFGSNFTQEQLNCIYSLGKILLDNKLREYTAIVEYLIEQNNNVSPNFKKMIVDYMETRVGLIRNTIDNVLKR